MLSGFAITPLDQAPAPVQVNDLITVRRLKESSASDPGVVMLLTFAPGAAFGEDRHAVREMLHVLAGEFSDGSDTWPAGTVICAEPGSVHYPQSETGCTVLAYYPDGEAAA